MSHARKQLRDAIVEVLRNLPTTGDRVYASRVRPHDGGDSALFVYALDEVSGRHAMGGALIRQTTFTVHGIAVKAEMLDDTLDQIAAEVEIAMAADLTFGITGVLDSALARSTIQLDGEGKAPTGSIRLEYQVQYRTTQAAPETFV